MNSEKKKLLTAAQVQDRFGLSPDMLLRWIRLRRVRPLRVTLGAGEVGSDLRFAPADIAAAVEASSFEPGSRGQDPMLG